jgi:hypothetical protein
VFGKEKLTAHGTRFRSNDADSNVNMFACATDPHPWHFTAIIIIIIIMNIAFSHRLLIRNLFEESYHQPSTAKPIADFISYESILYMAPIIKKFTGETLHNRLAATLILLRNAALRQTLAKSCGF